MQCKYVSYFHTYELHISFISYRVRKSRHEKVFLEPKILHILREEIRHNPL
jgi:hypothetical protein